MYEKFFGFSEKPFNIVPNPKFLYHSEKHGNALTYLEYAISEGTGFTLLTGGIGTGKTTLIRHLLNRIGDNKNVAVVFNTNVTSDQLFHLVLQEFDIEPLPGDKAKNLEQLNHFLIECYTKKIDPILIIDEAQNLSREALEEVRLLTNLQNDDQHLLQIILVGQPELKAKMEDPSLIQLNQRINVRYNLSELSEKETGEYISSRLKKAGGNPDIFEPDAVSLIYDTSTGVPRLINLLCDSALVYSFADETDSINKEIIEQVIEDQGSMGSMVSRKIPEVEPHNEPLIMKEPPAKEMSYDITVTETKMINLAKHFWRFQTDQEKQHALIDGNISEITLLLEKEKRKINTLESHLKQHLLAAQDHSCNNGHGHESNSTKTIKSSETYTNTPELSLLKKISNLLSGNS